MGGVVSCTVPCVRHVFLFDASSFGVAVDDRGPKANGPLPQDAVQAPAVSLHVAEAA